MKLQPYLFVARLDDACYSIIEQPLSEGRFKASALNPLRTLPADSVLDGLKDFKENNWKTSAIRSRAKQMKTSEVSVY